MGSIEDRRALISRHAGASASLEPSATERAGWQASVNALVNEFMDGLGSARTFARPLASPRSPHEPEGLQTPGDALAELKRATLADGILTAGPGHLGFVPGGGLYIGAIADHFAAATNAFCADAFASPASVKAHCEVMRWLLSVVGYGSSAWGDITSGGSHATLTALGVARYARGLRPRDYAKHCVYLTEHTHHCAHKVLSVLFAEEIVVRTVPLTRHSMDPAALARLIEQDRTAGFTPWAVLATAGTTNLGKVDDLAAIADVAHASGVWLHVDAAYGGFFALCPEKAAMFRGLAEADSVVLDPHKGMFLPYGCGAVLIQDGRLLRHAFDHSATYLQDRVVANNALRSPMDYSLELTRPFRSLRLWLALRVHGVETLRSALREKLALADHLAREIESIPRLRLVSPPDLSILAFRVETTGGEDADTATRALLERVNRHPEVFLTSTTLDGAFVIRIAVLSFRTHLETAERLLGILREEAGP